jgi:glyoxylase-like metal-dependent hydrolase (beta-lactamase superfamily II)
VIRQLPGTEKISLVRHLFANIYLIESDQGLLAVDAGNRGSTTRIVRKITELGYTPSDLRRILLTHGHFDHFGGAFDLQARTGAAIAAHRADLPAYEKGRAGIMPEPFNRILDRSGIFTPGLFGARPVKIDHLLEDGDLIGEWQVLHTPGHTPGTISLYSPQYRVLITGGWAIDRRSPWFRKSSTGNLFVRFISTDPAGILKSRQRLANLDFQTVLYSHFRPQSFPIYARQLQALAAKG